MTKSTGQRVCYRWSEPELEMLQGLTGDHPWRMVPKLFTAWSRRTNRRVRSARSLKDMAWRLGLSKQAEGKWLTVPAIATLLGISSKTVRCWLEEGKLLGLKWETPSNQGWWYVKRSALCDFARRCPQHFGGMDRTSLFLAFEDEDLADELAAMKYEIQGRAKPVVCIELKRRYASISEAARTHFVVEETLRGAMRTGQRAAGYRWRAA